MRRRQSSRSFGGRQGALFLGKPQAENFGLGSHNLDSKHSQTLYLHHCGFPPSRAKLLVSVSRKLQRPLLILSSGPEATGGRGLVAAPASVSAGCASSRGSAPVDKRDSSRLAWLPPLTCFFFLLSFSLTLPSLALMAASPEGTGRPSPVMLCLSRSYCLGARGTSSFERPGLFGAHSPPGFLESSVGWGPGGGRQREQRGKGSWVEQVQGQGPGRFIARTRSPA